MVDMEIIAGALNKIVKTVNLSVRGVIISAGAYVIHMSQANSTVLNWGHLMASTKISREKTIARFVYVEYLNCVQQAKIYEIYILVRSLEPNMRVSSGSQIPCANTFFVPSLTASFAGTAFVLQDGSMAVSILLMIRAGLPAAT